MRLQKQLCLTLFLLIAVLVIFDCTSLDVWVQNHFYNANAVDKPPLERWLVYKFDRSLEFWFHKSIKIAVAIFGGCVFLLALAGFRVKWLAPYRYRLLFLACAMGLVSLIVGGAKHVTNTYCPNQTVLYGGDKPYVKVMERYPAGYEKRKKGRCFPAGHATAGFGLMALYFVFRSRRARLAGLAFGLTLGWVLGVFQIIRGEHFLSHTVFTMIASWLVILLTAAVFGKSLPGKAEA